MNYRICLLLLVVTGMSHAWAAGNDDDLRKDRLLRLHRTILIGDNATGLPVGAVALGPDASTVVEGGTLSDGTSPSPSAQTSPAAAVPDASPDPSTTLPKSEGPYPSILDGNMIVAYYGNPFSPRMGVLGEQSMEETAKMVKLPAQQWDDLNGDQKVIPAFHLIYATVWADAGVGILSDKVVQQYIDYAAQNDMIVILDHQLGKMDVSTAVKSMLRWLKYPNVHLAIDPEWKTMNPGKEIGSIDAADVNAAEELMQEYLVKENIQQKKLLLVHQFNWRMIMHREKVRTDFDRVDLIHNADGFGSPQLKLDTYAFVALAKNMPIKGFKLFFPKAWKTEGFDKPMLSPQQILNLVPRPVYINYQ